MTGADTAEGEILLSFAARILEGLFVKATAVGEVGFDLDAECLVVLFGGVLGGECLLGVAGCLAINEALAGCFVEVDCSAGVLGVHEFSFELRDQAWRSDF